MTPFWEGFFSVFGYKPKRNNLDNILEDTQKPFEWYHEGEWYEHPMYKDKFKN